MRAWYDILGFNRTAAEDDAGVRTSASAVVELIDREIMTIVAKAMIRNKPDSYCQAWDVTTRGISDFVGDLVRLYGAYGVDASARPAYLGRYSQGTRGKSAWRKLWDKFSR